MQLKKSIIERATTRPLRIGGYLRVSTKDQAIEGDSLPAQRSFMERVVTQWKEAGIPIEKIEFYEDGGRSGKNLKRPEFRRLQYDVQRGELDLVLAMKIDRLSRNTDDFRIIEQVLEEHKVEFCPINDFYDPSNAQGWFMRHMTIGQAEYERRVIGERTRDGLNFRARQGWWNGGFLYGYRKDEQTEKLVPHPEEAEIVRKHFFDAFERLGSVGRVLEHLGKVGIRYPIRRTGQEGPAGFKPFEKQQVRRILENEVYLGHIVWSKIRTEHAHEAIISQEQFARVQRQLNQNRKGRANSRYSRGRQSPLRNLVRCGCGHRMTPKGGTGRNGTHHYYECTRTIHQGGRLECCAPRIPAAALEGAVLRCLRRLSTSQQARQRVVEEALRQLGEEAQRAGEEAALVRQRLGTVQGEINNLVGVLKVMGAGALETVKDELHRLESERQTLRDQLRQLDEQQAPKTILEHQARKFIESWSDIGELLEQANLEEQRVILHHLIEVIELRSSDPKEKRGTYLLKIFPEVGPLDFGGAGSNDSDPNPSNPANGSGDRVVLTENGVVRQFGKKAPRLGLEPRT